MKVYKFREIAKLKFGKPSGGISYREAETNTGYNHSYIHRIIIGKKDPPINKEFYIKMAELFDVNPHQIYEYNEIKAIEVTSKILEDEDILLLFAMVDDAEVEEIKLRIKE
ncbi:MAG: hypothetical protein ACFFC6_11295 [Promethearchaeota archaeon]